MSVKPSEIVCVPLETGLDSTPRAVARRLTAMLNALSAVNHNVARGTLPEQCAQFRVAAHTALQAAGWRVNATDTGWRVLPPKAVRRG